MYHILVKLPADHGRYQALYVKIANAHIQGRLDIHDALLFQTAVMDGKHTARSGRFLREFPGRLLLYPLEAATCTVIFFGGDKTDGCIAAVCGLATGLVQYGLLSYEQRSGSKVTVVVDVAVGTITGAIGGLFYLHGEESSCLSAIFMGTLYWCASASTARVIYSILYS